MMSILALTGFAFGGLTGGDGDGDLPESAGTAEDALAVSADTLSLDLFGTPEETPVPPAPETLDFNRGDLITGFDPATDVLELEYSAALGLPEVTVTDFADGSGASIALNGVVVADVEGAQGLAPEAVVLKAV